MAAKRDSGHRPNAGISSFASSPRFFDGFPYLTTRVVATLYHIILLPADLTPAELKRLARRQAHANRIDTCLVLAAGRGLYLHPDGTEELSVRPPRGGIVVTGKLLAGEEFAASREMDHRTRELQAFERLTTSRGGLVLGDRTKGGRSASRKELLGMAGSLNGLPKGLIRCSNCCEPRGECLDPSPDFRGMIMRVHCRCENDNRCARCGGPLYERKLNANFWGEDGTIWHVPGFCGFGHSCPPLI